MGGRGSKRALEAAQNQARQAQEETAKLRVMFEASQKTLGDLNAKLTTLLEDNAKKAKEFEELRLKNEQEQKEALDKADKLHKLEAEQQKRFAAAAEFNRQKQEQEAKLNGLKEEQQRANQANFLQISQTVGELNAAFMIKLETLQKGKEYVNGLENDLKAKAQASGANIALLHDEQLNRQRNGVKTAEKDLGKVLRQYADGLDQFEKGAEAVQG